MFRITIGLLAVVALLFGAGHRGPVVDAQTAAAALTGTVTSKAEGAMEGVAVIAKRDGSPVLTSVMTDARGQYSFPRSHLKPGKYTIAIRAAGYVLPGSGTIPVDVSAEAAGRLDLALLDATTDQMANQLTTVDWLMSMPGTTAQKDLLVRKVVNCGFCHDMERTLRTRYTADQFLPVISRMATYAADNSAACGPGSALICDAKTSGRYQQQSVPRPPEGLSYGGADARLLAEYLASVNLSGGRKTWNFPLKAMPRPKGRATRAIVTVFPIPRQPNVIHDLAVDQNGHVWYGDSGWGYLGKLEPKTATFKEYEAPQRWPEPQAGLKRVLGVQDVEVDAVGRVWAVLALGGKTLAYFDPAREAWKEFEMPGGVWAFLPSFHKGQADTVWTTGRPPDGGNAAPLTAYRLNAKTGQVEASFPIMVDASGRDFSGPMRLDVYGMSSARPFCYQIARDAQDNFLCNDFYGSNIIRVNAKTGKTTIFPTPTPHAAPRRGRGDGEGRYWFGEFWGDKAAMLDLATGTIREFPFSTKYMSAYAAAPDARGEGWASSTGSDRVMRINPQTGETTEYLMPVYYDARKVVVDPSTANTTVWLPNKNLAQLIRIEPLD